MDIRVMITRDKSGTVRRMNIEEYLRGVVPSEIPASSGDAALRAQSIAARTYAMNKIRSGKGQSYDVDDTTKNQAYKAGKSDPRTDAAIRATAGQVLMYGGRLCDAVFSSCNGGHTTSAKQRWGNEIAYLPSKPDPYDARSGYTKFGHGVGMSQRGAQQMAKEGLSCADILAFYYPGAIMAVYDGGIPAQQTGDDDVEYAICTGDKVHIRIGPGTQNRILGKLDRGDKILVLPAKGGWCETAACIGGKMTTGFISAQYVKTV